MTGWLVRSIGSLIIVASIGAVGGSINYLNNRKEDIKGPEIKKQKRQSISSVLQITRTETTTVQLPRGLKRCEWLGANGFTVMASKTENSCTTFAKNRLKVEFSEENRGT